jgi:hypothetical protein
VSVVGARPTNTEVAEGCVAMLRVRAPHVSRDEIVAYQADITDIFEPVCIQGAHILFSRWVEVAAEGIERHDGDLRRAEWSYHVIDLEGR